VNQSPPRDDDELEDLLSRPSSDVIDALRRTPGDVVVLGAGGKMGPSLSAMLRRAASLVEGKPLRLIKGSRRRKHMLYDVPVIGPQTIAVMRETNATALSIDAGRTLLLDRTELLRQADAAQIAIIAQAHREYPPQSPP